MQQTHNTIKIHGTIKEKKIRAFNEVFVLIDESLKVISCHSYVRVDSVRVWALILSVCLCVCANENYTKLAIFMFRYVYTSTIHSDFVLFIPLSSRQIFFRSLLYGCN